MCNVVHLYSTVEVCDATKVELYSLAWPIKKILQKQPVKINFETITGVWRLATGYRFFLKFIPLKNKYAFNEINDSGIGSCGVYGGHFE